VRKAFVFFQMAVEKSAWIRTKPISCPNLLKRFEKYYDVSKRKKIVGIDARWNL
jgi:hypothetical protein